MSDDKKEQSSTEETNNTETEQDDPTLLQMGGVVIIKGGGGFLDRGVNVISEDDRGIERPFRPPHWERNAGEHQFTRNSQITNVVLRYQNADGTYRDVEHQIPHEIRVIYS